MNATSFQLRTGRGQNIESDSPETMECVLLTTPKHSACFDPLVTRLKRCLHRKCSNSTRCATRPTGSSRIPRRRVPMSMPPSSPHVEPHMNMGAQPGSTLPDHMTHFARFVRGAIAAGPTDRRPETLRAWLDLAEAYRITEALQECNGNRSAAARLLGIGRRTLYAKMEKLGISPSWRAAGITR